MIEATLVTSNIQTTTVDELLEYLNTVAGIFIYSYKEYVGTVFYDPNDNPVTWSFLKGIDFTNIQVFESLEDLIKNIKVDNMSIKVLYKS